MKTSDFKKKVEEIGFQIREDHSNLTICNAPLYMEFADLVQINTEHSRMLYTFSRWANIDSDVQKQLWPVLVEYAGTPIAKRKDESKFYVNLFSGRNGWLNWNDETGELGVNTRDDFGQWHASFKQNQYNHFRNMQMAAGYHTLPKYDPDNLDVFIPVPVEEDE